MRDADQEPRQPGYRNSAQVSVTVGARNLARLKEIVEQHGWPTISLVGVDGAAAAFLLAQHADR
jgi:hypothetical protein